ncbi:hypothetical protein CONPUDRAFT_83674 [Coniophora puteana RWD-64-598 SS2]|uniref:Uncharacterized protein n=1 Tax=Coniophora puteana (strain RWD-64-598) TaxID=741705 RepID=A0A5M3MGG6_CONPW|nr:uncharacterized protein CONPUDRAFT_83674 [Coniophora puteana RWD-64-598 SS2]EIW78147.1 hypothetical protein CONPUDRAFT_83674 [Coniophora puteana RWD-64-598 SS2]
MSCGGLSKFFCFRRVLALAVRLAFRRARHDVGRASELLPNECFSQDFGRDASG